MSERTQVRAMTVCVGPTLLIGSLTPLALTGSNTLWYPYWNDSPAYLATWFADNSVRAVLQGVLSNLSYMLVIWFSVVLSRRLQEAQTRTTWNLVSALTPLSVGQVVMTFLANGYYFMAAAASNPIRDTSDILIKYSYQSAAITGAGYFLLTAMYLVIVAVLVYQTKALRPWVAHSAIIIAAVAFLNYFSLLVDKGWLAPVGWSYIAALACPYAWIAAVCVALYRRPVGAETTPDRTNAVKLRISFSDLHISTGGHAEICG